MTFKLHNNTKKPIMKINMSVDPDNQGECLIVGFEPQLISRVLPESFALFKLELFPKVCGINRVKGLYINESD